MLNVQDRRDLENISTLLEYKRRKTKPYTSMRKLITDAQKKVNAAIRECEKESRKEYKKEIYNHINRKKEKDIFDDFCNPW